MMWEFKVVIVQVDLWLQGTGKTTNGDLNKLGFYFSYTLGSRWLGIFSVVPTMPSESQLSASLLCILSILFLYSTPQCCKVAAAAPAFTSGLRQQGGRRAAQAVSASFQAPHQASETSSETQDWVSGPPLASCRACWEGGTGVSCLA